MSVTELYEALKKAVENGKGSEGIYADVFEEGVDLYVGEDENADLIATVDKL